MKAIITLLRWAWPLAVVLLLGACQSEEPRFRVGFAQCEDNEWRRQMDREMQIEAQYLGTMELDIRNAKGNSEQQAADIDALLADGVDLLIVSPNDTTIVRGAVSRAVEAGVPVVVVDRRYGSDDYTAFIGTDNYKIGQEAGRYVIGRLGGHGRVAEVTGLSASSAAQQRHEGFVDALAAAPGISLVERVDGQWLHDVAEREAATLLVRQPELDFIFAHSDRMALGAAEAAASAGREVDVVGVDALHGHNNGLELVERGVIDATIYNPPSGYKVIGVANAILTGQPYPRETRLPVTLVDTSNASLLNTQLRLSGDREERIAALNRRMDRSLANYASQQMLLVSLAVILVLTAALMLLALKAYMRKKRQTRHLALENRAALSLSREVETTAQTKMTFFTNIAHGLRTPLSLVLAPAMQLIEDPTLNEAQRQLVKGIKRNALVMTNLVNQVMQLRKEESGTLRLQLRNVDLRSLLQEWADAFHVLALRLHVHFVMHLPAEDKGHAVGAYDSEKLEVMVYNLLSNAFKFTPENGRVELELDEMTDEDGRVWTVLRVSDTGRGIPAAHVPNIFKRFYQVDEEFIGTGIGLAVVKSFAALHGGRVDVESREGRGTTFIVRLPWREPKADEPAIHTSPFAADAADGWATDPDESLTTDAERPLVLVVDDSVETRRYLHQLLSPTCRVALAESGRTGMKRALELQPDLVICDMRMEGLTGLGCLRRLKQETTTSHIPVMILTATDPDNSRTQAYEEGADAFMSKPFDPKELVALATNLAGRHFRQRDHWDWGVSVREGETSEADKPFATRLHSLIEARLHEHDLSVEDLGTELGLGRTQLYRRVKALTNYSPVELLRAARLKRAALLLSTTEKTVSEVAYLVGFSSPSYFAKCYKEYFGESPTDFLRRKRGEA